MVILLKKEVNLDFGMEEISIEKKKLTKLLLFILFQDQKKLPTVFMLCLYLTKIKNGNIIL